MKTNHRFEIRCECIFMQDKPGYLERSIWEVWNTVNGEKRKLIVYVPAMSGALEALRTAENIVEALKIKEETK